MHPNPAFRKRDTADHIAFARDRAFGILSVNADDGPLLSHIPFLISEDGTSADLHLVRSNPIARLDDVPAVIAISGPDSYISPDWYGLDDQVPTWNYVAVHLRGHLEGLPHDQLDDMLARQSAAYENRLLPKKPWTLKKLSEETHRRFLRMILPFRLHITSVDGTWKLNQNKPGTARHAAAASAETAGLGQSLGSLAALMRDADE